MERLHLTAPCSLVGSWTAGGTGGSAEQNALQIAKQQAPSGMNLLLLALISRNPGVNADFRTVEQRTVRRWGMQSQ